MGGYLQKGRFFMKVGFVGTGWFSKNHGYSSQLRHVQFPHEHMVEHKYIQHLIFACLTSLPHLHIRITLGWHLVIGWEICRWFLAGELYKSQAGNL